MTRIRVTQTKSLIGCPQDQRRTVKALGLKRIGHSVEHEDSPSIRGMIFKVRHLVRSEGGGGAAGAAGSTEDSK